MDGLMAHSKVLKELTGRVWELALDYLGAFWWGMIHRRLGWEGMAAGDLDIPSLASRLVVNHPGQTMHSPFSRFSKVRMPLLILGAHFGVSPLA